MSVMGGLHKAEVEDLMDDNWVQIMRLLFKGNARTYNNMITL